MVRRIGTSTRIVDRCVQELFTNGKTFLYDGRDSSWENTVAIFHRFGTRMRNEHNHIRIDAEEMVMDGIKCFKIWII